MLNTSLKPLIFSSLAFSSHLMATGLTAEQRLGKKLFKDINLSIQRNQSCESCHSLSPVKVSTKTKSGQFEIIYQAAPSFVDPENIQHGNTVANGSKPRAFDSLNPPSIGYAAFSPEFHWDGELFIGGQFWNSHAANLVEQAKGPFLNLVEMAMPTEWSVIQRLQENRHYARLFKKIYGIQLNTIEKSDSTAISDAFDAIAKAISAFESSPVFNQFNSKFDYEAAGITQYNDSEQRGVDLFDGNAMCNLCHTTEAIDGEGSPALLTDFSYDNLGVPPNPFIPGNPDADVGLLGNPNLNAVRRDPSLDSEVEGRHKVRV